MCLWPTPPSIFSLVKIVNLPEFLMSSLRPQASDVYFRSTQARSNGVVIINSWGGKWGTWHRIWVQAVGGGGQNINAQLQKGEDRIWVHRNLRARFECIGLEGAKRGSWLLRGGGTFWVQAIFRIPSPTINSERSLSLLDIFVQFYCLVMILQGLNILTRGSKKEGMRFASHIFKVG